MLEMHKSTRSADLIPLDLFIKPYVRSLYNMKHIGSSGTKRQNLQSYFANAEIHTSIVLPH